MIGGSILIKILVIDDQKFKLEDIKKQFNPELVIGDAATNIHIAKSKISSTSYDLILLDMTIKDSLSYNEFVGIDILTYLEDINAQIPVVVVTQFYNFKDISESSSKSGYYKINKYYKNRKEEYDFSPSNDIHYLPHLHEYLSQNFCDYYGCILYIQNNTIWVDSLKKVLYQLGGSKYENVIIR